MPGSGTLANTLPWDGPNTEPTFSPLFWRPAVAAATDFSHSSLGTCTVGGPVEMKTVTVVPGWTGVPMPGSVWSTYPAGVVVEGAGRLLWRLQAGRLQGGLGLLGRCLAGHVGDRRIGAGPLDSAISDRRRRMAREWR